MEVLKRKGEKSHVTVETGDWVVKTEDGEVNIIGPDLFATLHSQGLVNFPTDPNKTRVDRTEAEVLSAQIDEIMDTFDFSKVAKIMQAVNWRWGANQDSAIPDEPDIRIEVRRLLRGAAERGRGTSTGGFTIFIHRGFDTEDQKPFVSINLIFGPTSLIEGETYDS